MASGTVRIIQAYLINGSSVVAARARSAIPARPLQAHGSEVTALDTAHLNLGGSVGRALPQHVQKKMEAFFRADFSDVRIHQGPQAQSIGAHAFTMGSAIYFAPGQYAPDTARGQQLLGHELAHVIQQRSGRVRAPAGSGTVVVNDHALEAEADRMGARAAAFRPPIRVDVGAALAAAPGHAPALQRHAPVQCSRIKSAAKLFAVLPPQTQRWVASLAQGGWGNLDALSGKQWPRLKAFLKALRHVPDMTLPDVHDDAAVGAFVYDLLNLAQRIGRLPPGYSTGVQMEAVDPDGYDDRISTVKGVRAYKPSLLHARPHARARHIDGRHDTSFVRPVEFFREIDKDLSSSDQKTRLKAQALLRGKDKEYRGTQSLVFSPFISTNRDALRRLALDTQGADLIVSLERGGSYVADQIETSLIALGRPTIPHLRIPKPTQGELDGIKTAIDNANRLRAPDGMLDAFDKKTSHVLMLIRAIEKQIEAAPRETLNLVVAETVVGGGSTNGLLKGLSYLLRRYQNLRVRLLLHRHASHQVAPDNPRASIDRDLAEDPLGPLVLAQNGGQQLRLSNLSGEIADGVGAVITALGAALRARPPLQLAQQRHGRWEKQFGLRVASGFYVLGEDIDAFLSGTKTVKQGEVSVQSVARVPVLVFKGERGVVIRPGTSMNSRQLLQMIVAGAFDGMIEALGIHIQDEPDPKLLAFAHKRGFL